MVRLTKSRLLSRARAALLLFVALTLSAICTPAASAQSGFTRQRNSVYAKLAYNYFRGNDFYNLSGNEITGATFQQHSVQLYAEYGIIDALDVIVNAPLVRVNTFDTTGNAVGFGDIELSLKGGHHFGPVHLALMLTADLPTGNDEASAIDSLTGFPFLMPTGDGEFNFITTAAASFSIHQANMWINTHVSYNLRTEGFTDQVRFGAAVGHFLLNTLYLQATLRGQVGVSEGNTSVSFLFGEGTEYLSLGGGISYPIPHTPISVGVDFEYPVALRQNLYAGPFIGFGVSYEYTP